MSLAMSLAMHVAMPEVKRIPLIGVAPGSFIKFCLKLLVVPPNGFGAVPWCWWWCALVAVVVCPGGGGGGVPWWWWRCALVVVVGVPW